MVSEERWPRCTDKKRTKTGSDAIVVEGHNLSAGMKKGAKRDLHVIFRDAAWQTRVRALLLVSQAKIVPPSGKVKLWCLFRLVDEPSLNLDGIRHACCELSTTS